MRPGLPCRPHEQARHESSGLGAEPHPGHPRPQPQTPHLEEDLKEVLRSEAGIELIIEDEVRPEKQKRKAGVSGWLGGGQLGNAPGVAGQGNRHQELGSRGRPGNRHLGQGIGGWPGNRHQGQGDRGQLGTRYQGQGDGGGRGTGNRAGGGWGTGTGAEGGRPFLQPGGP